MDELLEKFREERLTEKERLDFLDELYWLDWNDLESKDIVLVEEIFGFLKSKKRTVEEISLILKLYNNPGGEYVEKFSNIISSIYRRDRLKFFKALDLERDEISNLVYLFRNNKVFEDEKQEEKEIILEDKLSEDQIETAKEFYRAYETVCST